MVSRCICCIKANKARILAKNPNVGGTAGELVPYKLAKHADLYGLFFLLLIAVQASMQ